MVSMVGLIPRTMDGPFDLSHAVNWPVRVLSILWSTIIQWPLSNLNPDRLRNGTQAKGSWGFEILESILASGDVYRILQYGSRLVTKI